MVILYTYLSITKKTGDVSYEAAVLHNDVMIEAVWRDNASCGGVCCIC